MSPSQDRALALAAVAIALVGAWLLLAGEPGSWRDEEDSRSAGAAARERAPVPSVASRAETAPGAAAEAPPEAASPATADPDGVPKAAAPPATAPAPLATPPREVSEPEEIHAIRSGETLELAAAGLPADGPLLLDLELGEPSASAAPLPARVLAPDGRQLQTPGALPGGDLRTARVEIDASWLVPGRYVVEIQTTERSHFPLRRYALVVR